MRTSYSLFTIRSSQGYLQNLKRMLLIEHKWIRKTSPFCGATIESNWKTALRILWRLDPQKIDQSGPSGSRNSWIRPALHTDVCLHGISIFERRVWSVLLKNRITLQQRVSWKKNCIVSLFTVLKIFNKHANLALEDAKKNVTATNWSNSGFRNRSSVFVMKKRHFKSLQIYGPTGSHTKLKFSSKKHLLHLFDWKHITKCRQNWRETLTFVQEFW
jgi:hypothetical protein